MSVRLVYFAWVRERIGLSGEEYPLTQSLPAGELAAKLRALSAGHAEALTDLSRLRLALNQQQVGWDALVSPGDELALFPPVTGG
ncbi:MoaD/ThiS family protein [Sandaracinobacter neustonicus]|uniref:Molybdopterin synthase sulfur carrier subunit n=1 Tax=Sandaracinobacter neustonicus TaxID=1715348 RepID=A0A501XEF7_9SPHN|nr:MoaD/ThiS family protein [Sandaracinobacter neustonicus]TPE59028.1 MoaD/ThiS family protein [Sandaracinobacter neustonicus]